MLIKIIFAGIVLCLINIFLKKQSNEFVLPVEIIFLTVSTWIITESFQDVFSGIYDIATQIEYGEEIIFSSVKGAGICLITKFSSDICVENGNRLVADVIEFTGRVTLSLIAVPYIESIMNIALSFLK